jgi:hypothetical protein
MGDKQISIRTLPDGTRAHHHPPDQLHPDGRLVLIQENSPMRAHLDSRHDHHKVEQERLHDVHRQQLADKKAALVRGGVPASKRCC